MQQFVGGLNPEGAHHFLGLGTKHDRGMSTRGVLTSIQGQQSFLQLSSKFTPFHSPSDLPQCIIEGLQTTQVQGSSATH
jgi:hypothetical protein